jgi:hypothetical protein
MWLALDLLVIGLGVVVIGFIGYILIFAELTRRRRNQALTAEGLYIHLFSYAGVSAIVIAVLNLLDAIQPGSVIPLPPAVLQGMNLALNLCAVTGPIAAVAGLVVLLRHRASATSR